MSFKCICNERFENKSMFKKHKYECIDKTIKNVQSELYLSMDKVKNYYDKLNYMSELLIEYQTNLNLFTVDKTPYYYLKMSKKKQAHLLRYKKISEKVTQELDKILSIYKIEDEIKTDDELSEDYDLETDEEAR